MDESRGAPIEKAIDAIRADNISGTAEINRTTVLLFSQLDPAGFTGSDRACSFITDICSRLVAAQPEMASLRNLVAEVADSIDSTADPHEVIKSAMIAAGRFGDRAVAAVAAAARHAGALIKPGGTVLTHSRSSTVRDAFFSASRGGRFNLIITESRPALEGRKLAAELAREEIQITLIADSAAALVMQEPVDLVMVGADMVTPEAVVNKIGTRMITLAATERA